MLVIAIRSEVAALRYGVYTLVVESLSCFFLTVFVGLR